MITTINEWKSLLEFNSSFEQDWDLHNIYSPEEIVLRIEKDLTSVKDNYWSYDKIKSYLRSFIDKIITLPYGLKLKLFKAFIFTFAGMIALPDMTASIDANKKIKPEEAVKLKTELTVYYKKEIEKKNMETKYKLPTEFSDTLVEFLKHEEGIKGKAVLTAYDIGDGMITIGYGHAEKKNVTKMIAGKTKITEQQAEDLLVQDIMEAQRGVDKILNDWKKAGIKIEINQNMYDALISMTYNMGIGNMRKSDFIQFVKRAELQKAADKIKTTNVTYPGHVTRRKKESFMFQAKNDINLNDILKSIA